jgi:microcompartment protein CcmK/EutM
MATKKQNFLMYKGKPLVRKGNSIYYGYMSESHVAMLTIQSTKKKDNLTLADKVLVQIIATDPTVPPQEMVVKKSVKNGLYSAIDIASIWLDRQLKK